MFRMYEWKPNDLWTRDSGAVIMENEPRVTFSTTDCVDVFVLTSTAMFYNRDAFPHDSYRQAARRTFDILDRTLSSYLTDGKRSFNFRLKEWKEFPIRVFEVSHTGAIAHNYDNLDTWHWWFLEALSNLIREKYNT